MIFEEPSLKSELKMAKRRSIISVGSVLVLFAVLAAFGAKLTLAEEGSSSSSSTNDNGEGSGTFKGRIYVAF